jgi:hypothetical protein
VLPPLPLRCVDALNSKHDDPLDRQDDDTGRVRKNIRAYPESSRYRPAALDVSDTRRKTVSQQAASCFVTLGDATYSAIRRISAFFRVEHPRSRSSTVEKPMKQQPYRLLFDKRDHELLRIVNDELKQNRSHDYVRRTFNPLLHPNGIKEMAESKGLRIAYAVVAMVSSLEVGDAD